LITTVLFLIMAILLVFQAAIGLSFLISCIWEKERRASFFAMIQFLGMLGLVVVLFSLKAIDFFETGAGFSLLIAGLIGAGGATFLLVQRSAPNQKALQGTRGLIVGKVERFDERKQVFARNRSLPPGSEQYKTFYEEHPELEQYDRTRREKGGPLGHPGSIDGSSGIPNVAATFGAMSIPLHLSAPEEYHPQQHPEFKDKKIDLSREEVTERVKGYARMLGIEMVGITEINPLWIYSHRGEIFNGDWENWGAKIESGHKYAVVMAEEMDFRLVGTAPHTPTTIESMRNYARGAFISTQLAAFIANLGYSATANHLRHYDAMLVPLAVDAGLGELGRLGYLVTKTYGPRIRLSVVTTDLPLIPDKPIDIGLEDFCRICKKCATCCPSKSIPLDEQKPFNGTLRWKLNEETCFDYWGKIGTDCCVCMRVCPWGHAATFPHRLIKWIVSRNNISRRIFSVMDDLFYGRKPRPKNAPVWAGYEKNKSRESGRKVLS